MTDGHLLVYFLHLSQNFTAMSDDEKKRLLDSDDKFDEELTRCGATLPCNPRRGMHRYLILIIMCFLSFGKLKLYILKFSCIFNKIITNALEVIF